MLPKKFDKEAVFKEVDESNKRFENYTEEQRKLFRDLAIEGRQCGKTAIKLQLNSLYGQLGNPI
jgi:hypothetical protein